MIMRICPIHDVACNELFLLCADCPERASALDLACTIEQAIDEYLSGYVMEGDGGCHSPNEGELMLIKDAIMGLLVDPAFMATQEKP